jgi:hypothetical protein
MIMGSSPHKQKTIDYKPVAFETLPEMSAPDIKSSIETALQSAAHSAAENLFGDGTFRKIMDETVARVTTLQSTYHGYYSARDLPKNGSNAGGENKEDKQVRSKKARVCHRTSSTGVLFGKVWVRTTTVKVAKAKVASKESVEIVTSFVFYPSWYLTRMGLGRGMEANLSSKMPCYSISSIISCVVF